jgi:hypothetical protein
MALYKARAIILTVEGRNDNPTTHKSGLDIL